MTYTELLKSIWIDIYDTNKCIDVVFDKYIHQHYSQCINGITMGREQYKQHVIQQHKLMSVDRIIYDQIIEQQNELFALYYPEGKNTLGVTIKAEVIAYFRFVDKKLQKIHGQVRLIEGDLLDVDMKK